MHITISSCILHDCRDPAFSLYSAVSPFQPFLKFQPQPLFFALIQCVTPFPSPVFISLANYPSVLISICLLPFGSSPHLWSSLCRSPTTSSFSHLVPLLASAHQSQAATQASGQEHPRTTACPGTTSAALGSCSRARGAGQRRRVGSTEPYGPSGVEGAPGSQGVPIPARRRARRASDASPGYARWGLIDPARLAILRVRGWLIKIKTAFS